jgi:Spy/CpxP family protein refolding chaperone
MTKAKLVFLLAFVLVFGAGAVVGMVQQQHHHGKDEGHGGGRLSDQLALTPDQQQQMKQIWSAVDNSRHETWDKRREFQKQRDQELRNLLTDAQKTKFDAVAQDYQQKIADLNAQHEKLVETAVANTKAMLSDTQRLKYEEIRKSWSDHPGGRHGPRGMNRGETRPTTNPN